MKNIKNTFVQQAIADKRWAFVADYVRLYALYHEGGIYFDTDVKLYHDCRDLLSQAHVVIPTQSSITTGHNLMSAVIAASVAHPFVKKCLDYYGELQYDPNNYHKVVINPIMSEILHQDWCYKFENITQHLNDDILILDRSKFESDYDIKDDNHQKYFGVHFCNQSWVPTNRGILYNFCKSNDMMRLYRTLTKIISIFRR